MENNGDRGVTNQEKMVGLQNRPPDIGLLSDGELSSRLTAAMACFQDTLDSPRTQLILRNAALTLLELPGHEFSVKLVYDLLTDDGQRSRAVKTLSEETPQYWSKEWDSLWRKDVDPLLSISQQRIAKRNSLLVFWSREWDQIPAGPKAHMVRMLERMVPLE